MRSRGKQVVIAILICIMAVGCGPAATPSSDQPHPAPSGAVKPTEMLDQAVTVTTLAGSGKTGPLGGGYQDGPALSAQFHDPMGLALDAHGNLYVSDWVNHRIRMIAPDGTVTTVAGGGPSGSKGGMVDGPASTARFFGPEGLTVDTQGNVLVADTLNNRIRRISPDGIVTTIAGSGPGTIYGFDGALVNGPAETARFNDPSDVAVDASGVLYVTDRLNHVIRKITPDGQVSTFAGTGQPGAKDGRGEAASFEIPNRIAIDEEGNLYVTEGRFLDFGERTYGFRVRRITAQAEVTTLAGTGKPGYQDGPTLTVQFNVPIGITIDGQGTIYVADTGAHRIRLISPDGTVSTVAGSGLAGYADGPATIAQFWYPTDIAVGDDGSLYVADWKNHRIRLISDRSPN
jgi:sugar lactone lactonase YvrE